MLIAAYKAANDLTFCVSGNIFNGARGQTIGYFTLIPTNKATHFRLIIGVALCSHVHDFGMTLTVHYLSAIIPSNGSAYPRYGKSLIM